MGTVSKTGELIRPLGFDSPAIRQNWATSGRTDSRPLGRCCGSRPQVATKYGALVESGLLHLFAKETGCKRSHRFESCTLRQICITETHKEGSHSGLVRQLGKLVDCQRSQGFKSPTLLQNCGIIPM